MEYKAQLPSNTLAEMSKEQRRLFLEVNEEQKLLLHDALESSERWVTKIRLIAHRIGNFTGNA